MPEFLSNVYDGIWLSLQVVFLSTFLTEIFHSKRISAIVSDLIREIIHVFKYFFGFIQFSNLDTYYISYCSKQI